MTLHDLARKSNKALSDNSPALLTAIGVTGTITTSYLAGKASFEAAHVLDNESAGQNVDVSSFTPQERIKLVWKLYIPAVGAGTVTVVAIVSANRIGSRRAAAMASAFAVSERFSQEYKDKVIEKLGENKERVLRDEIAQDQIDRNERVDTEVIHSYNGEMLCYEPYTGRYFRSSIEILKKAQNDTNYVVNNHGYASLSDFYNNAGIPTTSISDELGWNSNKLMELTFSTGISTAGEPCHSFSYQVEPIRNFYKVH